MADVITTTKAFYAQDDASGAWVDAGAYPYTDATPEEQTAARQSAIDAAQLLGGRVVRRIIDTTTDDATGTVTKVNTTESYITVKDLSPKSVGLTVQEWGEVLRALNGRGTVLAAAIAPKIRAALGMV